MAFPFNLNRQKGVCMYSHRIRIIQSDIGA